MEKLDIIAHGARGAAFPGNQESVGIAACVTAADGTPVKGLVKGNFKVRPLLTNAVHVGTAINLFMDYEQQDAALPGYYAFFVATTDNNIWVPGEFVFAVTVRTPASGRATAMGRTIAVLDIPHLPD